MSFLFTEKNLGDLVLPKNSNLINYSVLNEYYSASPFRSFSVKYVAQGSELYSVNGNKYNIRDKQYLLANAFSEGYVLVDSSKPVTGICIDVAPAILSEAVASHLRPDTPIPDPGLDVFLNSPYFLENRYNADQTHLGRFLSGLESVLIRDRSVKDQLSQDFYYTISEKIISDHLPILQQMQSIRAQKTQTKKDLLRKILKAKSMMDECFPDPVTIGSIARECGISEYHFFRLFRSVFSISPHQYLIGKRLDFARQLKDKEDASVSEMSICSGFSDIHSFSKAYKKRFGVSPSSHPCKRKGDLPG